MRSTVLASMRYVIFAAFGLFFFASYAQSQTAQSLLMPPNTSASPDFKGLSNGTLPGSANISKVNVHTLLYPGNTTKVLVHYLPWWNGSPRSSGITTGYRSDDPAYINGLFTDLSSRGVDGLIIDWYGQKHFTDTAWQASMPILKSFPKLSFSIMIDVGSFKFNACPGCDINDTILSNLDYMEHMYFPSSQYLKDNGHPVVTEFGITALPGVDWARIQAAHPEIYWLHLDNAVETSGFEIPSSAGSFLWIDPPPSTTVEKSASMAQPNYFYSNARSQPSKIPVGGAFGGFNNSLADWNGGKTQSLPQACGATWLSTFATINKYYNASNQLPFVQLITWDDYEEGSALETGINGCGKISVVANKPQQELTVSLSNSASFDHLELYQQVGNAFNQVGIYPATIGTISMKGYSGTFYLKAIGKPFIMNVLSSAIRY